MKKFLFHLCLGLLIVIGLMTFHKEEACATSMYLNENSNSNVNTFDVKKIVPEIVVIVVAGGVLLFCISKES